jgi:diaminohydroxyphosphoribosylaminopyrimidine deaminase/5-amino-6-(5-phosphoribosylamino)uracil reductase
LPDGARLFRDRFKEKTIVYRKKSLPLVLRDLGKKSVTSVLIEGGGSILGQALDAGLIDKVQIYLGPIFTGGPVIAFGGRGAFSTQTAVRLTRLSYAKLGDDVRVIGYPVYKSANAAE